VKVVPVIDCCVSVTDPVCVVPDCWVPDWLLDGNVLVSPVCVVPVDCVVDWDVEGNVVDDVADADPEEEPEAVPD
jgi:hypothetical protein